MTEARRRARQQFREMRFGMFIHWGIYSILERGEWVMFQEKIPVSEYEKLVPQFNPILYNAREWVSLAKRAGMKYITITAKHHDGFCMYDSDLTDYKVTNTPFKRDPIRELVQECRRQGLKLIFYYSPLDWHHPDYERNWDNYTRYWHGQVLELFHKYSPFGIWLDGCWHKPERLNETWQLSTLYTEIRRVKPGAIIVNNHHQEPLPDEDVQTIEQDLPGENTTGFNKAPLIANTLYETCMTINNSWGYHSGDHNYKSIEQLVRILATCAGRDANLLLNVGPKPDGTIQPEFISRLEGIGEWLSRNGASIYKTRGGDLSHTPWGTVTRRGSQYYLHIWNLPEPPSPLSFSSKRKVSKCWLLTTRDPLPFKQEGNQLSLFLPSPLPDRADTVVVVEAK